jgi:pimeloyl-ACP methyl ester carboxylesterase
VRRSVSLALAGATGALLAALAACALVERHLETNDAERLTAGETFFRVQGRRVRYRLTGAEHPGPTLVLLGGAAASLEQWDDVQKTLGETAPVVSYDRCGMGFSEPADAHDAMAQAEELEELLHAPGIRAPFVLLSYSNSANVARIFASEHRDQVRGIVFVDPVPDYGPRFVRFFGWHLTTMTVGSVLGYRRLLNAMASRHRARESPVLERGDAISMSGKHWLATDLDEVNVKHSFEEAEAMPPLGDLPVGILTTIDPDQSEYNRYVAQRQNELATKSSRTLVVRREHVNHSLLLSDPALIALVTGLLEKVEEASHAPGTSR